MEEVRISISEERYKELIEKEVRVQILTKKIQSEERYSWTEDIATILEIELPEKKKSYV